MSSRTSKLIIPAVMNHQNVVAHIAGGLMPSLPVIGWDSDGEPLVVDDETGRLVRANTRGKISRFGPDYSGGCNCG